VTLLWSPGNIPQLRFCCCCCFTVALMNSHHLLSPFSLSAFLPQSDHVIFILKYVNMLSYINLYSDVKPTYIYGVNSTSLCYIMYFT
jgi:hypothetical protein